MTRSEHVTGRALVFGASGFVGSAVCRRLTHDGWRVTAVTRSHGARSLSDALVEGDTLVLGASGSGDLQHALAGLPRPDVIINCAGAMPTAGKAGLTELVEGNIDLVASILDAATALRVPRVITLGSGFEYAPAETPLNELAPSGPTTLYGVTKLAASDIALHYRDERALDVCVIRPFSVYGPRERTHRFVPYVVTRALTGAAIEVSRGDQVRDYLFVDDLADLVVRAASWGHTLPPVLNASGTEVVDLKTMIDIVIGLTHARSELRLRTREPNLGDRQVFLGDSTLAETVFGWRPEHGLRAGLEATIAWYDRYRADWDVP